MFDPNVTGSFVMGLGPSLVELLLGLNWEPSDSYYNALTH